MTKRAPLSFMNDEIAGLVGKGEAVAVPTVAVPPVANPPIALSRPEEPVRPPRPRPAPAPKIIRPPPRAFSRTPETASRATARVQVGLRLTVDRHDQLRRIAFDLHQPVQAVIEEALHRFMDDYDAGEGG